MKLQNISKYNKKFNFTNNNTFIIFFNREGNVFIVNIKITLLKKLLKK